MSAVNRATKGGRRTLGTARKGRVGVVTVAWAVSRDAASRAWGVPGGEGEVGLRWVLDMGAGTCRVAVVDGDREVVLGEGGASGLVDGGLLHVQAAAGADEFTGTLRGDQLLYARTTLLSRAGVAGGRYEVVR